jgi:Domain of unknown function (DUF6438)
MRNLLLVLAFTAASGCAMAQTPAPPADAFIKLEEGGCGFISACPAYAITLTPDGGYRYEGYKHVAVIGVRDGQLSAGVWTEVEKAFAASGWSTLSEPTSRRGGYPCMPDSPFARIIRHISDSDAKVFSYNLGCDSEAGAALLNALKGLMPIPAAQ